MGGKNDMTDLTEENMIYPVSSDTSDPYQSFGAARLASSQFNDPMEGGQDLTHILNSKTAASRNGGTNQFVMTGGQQAKEITDLMIKGVAPCSVGSINSLGLPPHQQYINGGSNGANVESQKMVKTYEFHLPMHHIREEEQRSQMELYQSSSKYKTGIGLH